MTRWPLVLAVAVVLFKQRDKLACLLSGHPDARRQLHGGFRCTRCRKATWDLSGLGLLDEGFLRGPRRLYDREYRAVERLHGWDTPDRRARRAGL